MKPSVCTSLLLITTILLAGPLSGCTSTKKIGREIGHTTRDVSREIGHTTRDVARDIGQATREAAQSIDKAVDDALTSDL